MKHHTYTTIHLGPNRLPSRDRTVTAIVVFSLVVFSLALTIFKPHAPEPALQPQLTQFVYIVATPSPRPEPTEAPTSEPQIVYIAAPTAEPQVIYVQAAPAQPTPVEAAAEPTAEPWHPPLVYGEVRGWNGEVEQFTCGGPNVVPPACH